MASSIVAVSAAGAVRVAGGFALDPAVSVQRAIVVEVTLDYAVDELPNACIDARSARNAPAFAA